MGVPPAQGTPVFRRRRAAEYKENRASHGVILIFQKLRVQADFAEPGLDLAQIGAGAVVVDRHPVARGVRADGKDAWNAVERLLDLFDFVSAVQAGDRKICALF